MGHFQGGIMQLCFLFLLLFWWPAWKFGNCNISTWYNQIFLHPFKSSVGEQRRTFHIATSIFKLVPATRKVTRLFDLFNVVPALQDLHLCWHRSTSAPKWAHFYLTICGVYCNRGVGLTKCLTMLALWKTWRWTHSCQLSLSHFERRCPH